MANYTRIRGSKETIGIVLERIDSNPFVVSSATVTITHDIYHSGSWIPFALLAEEICTIDSDLPQKSHKIAYLWNCEGEARLHTATFFATLPDGQVIVRSVTIDVN